MTVFHIGEAGVADPELAGLLRDVAARAAEHPDTRQPGKLAGAMSHALDPQAGTQLGSVDVGVLGYHARLAAGDVLAAAVTRAREVQHPAADRLAAVAERWAAFTAAVEAVA